MIASVKRPFSRDQRMTIVHGMLVFSRTCSTSRCSRAIEEFE